MKRTIAAALAVLVVAPALSAQEPPRPRLPRGADVHDWEAYFELGETLFERRPDRAAQAFYWASRLDPSRAEPLFAQWAAHFAADEGTWVAYIQDDPRALSRPDVLRADSLAQLAFDRNPFVHRGLEAALWTSLGRRLRWDSEMFAFVAYARGQFPEAADAFGRMIGDQPGRRFRLLHWRALSYVGAGQLEPATADLQSLLQILREQDQQTLVGYYQSKARWEYALGMLYQARNDARNARSAYERALAEDLSYAPAHAALSRLSLLLRRPDDAVASAAQAVEIAPHDPVMHLALGNALMAAETYDQAVEAFRRVIRMEPYWAEPYLRLAQAHDAGGNAAEAVAAYRAWAERAPHRAHAELQRVNQRLQALGAG